MTAMRETKQNALSKEPSKKSYRMDSLDVLVVSDNRHILKLLNTILSALDVGKVRTVRRPASALSHLEHFFPDLVICDRKMKPIDGLDFVLMIRKSNTVTNRFVPIIMLSSDTEIQHVLEARDSGITEFVAKPLSPKVLYNRVVSIIERPRPYIRTKHYFGPCRRRRLVEWLGEERRGISMADDEFGGEDEMPSDGTLAPAEGDAMEAVGRSANQL